MHKSGIQVSEELKKAFQEATDSNVGVLVIQLQGEHFAVVNKRPRVPSLEAQIADVQKLLEETKPIYALIRSDDKWVTLAYVPDKAPVKEKMLYASSRSALKDGLGASAFTIDFFVSSKSECTMKNYLGTQKPTDENDRSMLTMEEVIAREAATESMKAMNFGKVKISGIADIPIKISETAETLLTSFAAGDGAALFLKLDQSEVLQAKAEAKSTTEELAAKLAGNEPAYILYKFTHQHEAKQNTSTIFVYYCPDSAIPRQKMFYSSCKSMVLKIIEGANIVIDKKVEVSEAKELTSTYVYDEMYPKTASKATFSKPKTKGKGARRLVGDGAKFNADQ